MPATLVLMRCDRLTGEWVREGRMTFEDDEHGPGAAKARAEGEAWVAEGSDERRVYSLLTRQAPFDWAREEARQTSHEPSGRTPPRQGAGETG